MYVNALFVKLFVQRSEFITNGAFQQLSLIIILINIPISSFLIHLAVIV